MTDLLLNLMLMFHNIRVTHVFETLCAFVTLRNVSMRSGDFASLRKNARLRLAKKTIV